MKLSKSLLYIAVAISVIGYLPLIYLNPTLYETLRFALYAIMLSLIACNFSLPQITHNRMLSNASIVVIIISILFLSFYAIGLNFTSSDLLQTIVPLCCVMIGYCGNYSKKSMTRIALFYIVLSVFVASISASTYSSIINAGYYSYLLEGKNQIGAIVAIATSLAIYILPQLDNKYLRIILVVGIIIGVFASYIIGCRSAFMALLILTIIIQFKRNHDKLFKYIFLSGIIIFFIYLICGDQIISLLNDFFIREKDVNDIDDVSSGRMERNRLAVDYILNNFFAGELIYQSNIPLIHNYLLLKFVRYGVFALPFVIYYLIFISHSFIKIKNSRSLSMEYVGFYIIIIPYIVSLLEPSAPFGPGSLYFFSYILYGFSLRQINLNKYNL